MRVTQKALEIIIFIGIIIFYILTSIFYDFPDLYENFSALDKTVSMIQSITTYLFFTILLIVFIRNAENIKFSIFIPIPFTEATKMWKLEKRKKKYEKKLRKYIAKGWTQEESNLRHEINIIKHILNDYNKSVKNNTR
jgi:hypothetical protein